MAIGIPSTIFVGSYTASVSPITCTTSADAPAGTLVVISLAPFGAGSQLVTGVTDSAGGNSYAQASISTTVDNYPLQLWYSILTNDLPLGGTITATGTWSGSGLAIPGVIGISGAGAGLDQHPTGTSSTGASSTSIATGTLASNSEIVIASAVTLGAFGTWTEGAGFTSIAGLHFGVGSFAYQIVSATAPVTWAPSWQNSTNFAASLASFKATASIVVSPIGLALAEY